MKFNFIFDTETTGLPKSRGFGNFYDYTDSAKYDSSRLVQIAWMICDDTGDVKVERTHIICPDGFTIPEESTKIHNISDAHAREIGVKFDKVVEHLVHDLKEYAPKRMVAHNLQFDRHVLLAELHRRGGNEDLLKHLLGMGKNCTMLTGKPLCNITTPKNPNWVKFPSLVELHEYLFHKPMEAKHEALYDTRMCAKCFVELRKVLKKKR